ncbi:hypothetical protein [Dictyobacter kobayashii]|uniref:Uncharacterized protein n=1 Tax=Dictyobacter kobayashii TaxID=2014872 RepID=A0A402AQ31_9CHLR|nr:hypothetical protein [Dictyobacter kobayashii]GCE21139.1 hypothetical protein KDK_49390 [Dictyobacter kobayashii]
MDGSKRTIFRHEALEFYLQNKEQTILPRVVAPPVLLMLWLLAALAVLAMGGACLYRVPVYAAGVGVITQHPNQTGSSSYTQALVFLPLDVVRASQLRSLHVGSQVHWRLATADQGTLKAVVGRVELSALAPEEIQQRYALDDHAAQLIVAPSFVIQLQLEGDWRRYAGSRLQVQVPIDTQSVISLLSGSNMVRGE